MPSYKPPASMLAVRDWPELVHECHYSVRTVADRCRVSVTQLRLFCRRTMAILPKPWFRQWRLVRAEVLLDAGNSDATAILRETYDQPRNELNESNGRTWQSAWKYWKAADPPVSETESA